MGNFEEDSKQVQKPRIKDGGIDPDIVFTHCIYCKEMIVGQMHSLLPLESTGKINGLAKGEIVYFPACVDCTYTYFEGDEDEEGFNLHDGEIR